MLRALPPHPHSIPIVGSLADGNVGRWAESLQFAPANPEIGFRRSVRARKAPYMCAKHTDSVQRYCLAPALPEPSRRSFLRSVDSLAAGPTARRRVAGSQTHCRFSLPSDCTLSSTFVQTHRAPSPCLLKEQLSLPSPRLSLPLPLLPRPGPTSLRGRPRSKVCSTPTASPRINGRQASRRRARLSRAFRSSRKVSPSFSGQGHSRYLIFRDYSQLYRAPSERSERLLRFHLPAARSGHQGWTVLCRRTYG